MKILTTIHSIDVLSKLDKSVELVMGNHSFACRLTASFSSDDIFIALDKGFKVHLLTNRIMNDVVIKTFWTYIQDYYKYVESIIVSDLGALQLLVSKGLSHLAVYAPENLITNSLDLIPLRDLNIKGFFPSHELNLNQLIFLNQNKGSLQLFSLIHGHINIFHSKRKLIYIQNGYHPKSKYYIEEEFRPNELLNVSEDLAGFHIFSDRTLFTYQNTLLHENIDYGYFDTIFYDDNYLLLLIDLYCKNRVKSKNSLIKDYHDKYMGLKGDKIIE